MSTASAAEIHETATESSDSAEQPLLSVRNMVVTYGGAGQGVDAVRGISFDIGRGEVFGLVGESGSGKSSVCSALMRLLPHSASVTADTIDFAGQDLTTLSEKQAAKIRGREIALVPQQPMTSLSPTTPVGRQLEWYLGDSLQDPEIRQILVNIGLRAVLDRPDDLPYRFSGGQLQRLLIAIATLAHRPSLLLADEPTTTLDATVQSQVLKLLLDVRDKLNLSILYVSHDLAVIAQVCERVGVLYGGRLVEVAPVAELFHHPQHPYTKALLGSMPTGWDGQQSRLETIPGSSGGSNRLPGCPFAPRCPLADETCVTTVPETRLVHKSMVACHKAEHIIDPNSPIGAAGAGHHAGHHTGPHPGSAA